VVALFGLLVGSFLNVVIYRLPIMLKRDWECQCRELLGENLSEQADSDSDSGSGSGEGRFDLVVPRSRCPKCGHQITAMENIPVFSYLFLRGRCRACANPISIRYPLIELLTGALSALMAWYFGFDWTLPGALILVWSLIAMSFIDIDEQLLPDAITLPVLWLGLLLNLGGLYTDSHSSLLGAVAGYLSLWSVYQVFKLLTGKEGMGYGDFKLLALFGAWMGWQYLLLVVMFSSLLGTGVQLTLMRFNRSEKGVPFSFGPYLAVAGLICFLWGEPIWKAYLGTLH
jgi:leader peptidase (prepilin peptidase)/N-methyltransferase